MANKKESTNISIAIGLRVKEIRQEKDMNGVDFSKLLNISPSKLSDVENGHSAFAAELIFDIANRLEISPSWLLTGKGLKRPPDKAGFLDDPRAFNMSVWEQIADRFFFCHSGMKDREIAEEYDVDEKTVKKWKKGQKSIPDHVIDKAMWNRGVSRRYLLSGELPRMIQPSEEMGRNIAHLRQSMYPGDNGKAQLLLKMGISEKRWNELTAGAYPTKNEQYNLAKAFNCTPLELFGKYINPDMIPTTSHPSEEEMKPLREYDRENQPPIPSQEYIQYANEIVRVQGLSNLLVAHLLSHRDNIAPSMLTSLAGVRQPLLSFQEALGNVLVHTENRNLKNA